MIRAVAASGPTKPLLLQQVPIPEAPEKGALIRIECTGICHSDVHTIDDDADIGGGNVYRINDHYPNHFSSLVPGHEIAGIVVSLGAKANAPNLVTGDRVVVYPWSACRECRVCQLGMSQICEQNPSGIKDIGQCSGYVGGFATYCPVPDTQYLVKLPESIQFDVGAMLACSGLTSFCALKKVRSELKFGYQCHGTSRLLIIGAGGLGTWAAQIAKNIFQEYNIKTTVVDTVSKKLSDLPKHCADATVTISRETPSVGAVVESLGGHMDAALDFVGSPATAQLAIDSLRKGGSVGLVGLRGGELPLSLMTIISKSVSIIGSRCGSLTDLKELVAIMSLTPIEPPRITPYALSDINAALDALRKGDMVGRGVVYMNMGTTI